MNREGPSLESLTHRLADTPGDFLSEPQIAGTGSVNAAAVAGDLLRLLGIPASARELAGLESQDARRDRNRLSVSLIMTWLLKDPWFAAQKLGLAETLSLLVQDAAELSAHTAAQKFVTDAERREEMARLALSRLGFRPLGESVAQAQDRLTSLSAAERARVMQAARAAEERARAIREALAKKAAEESADKWTRE